MIKKNREVFSSLLSINPIMVLYSHQTHQLWCHFKRIISNSKSHVRPLRPRITSLHVFIVYLLSYRTEIHRLTPTTKTATL
nr:MAG TPA: hypothetical protein [Caudoviricetes sp.]